MIIIMLILVILAIVTTIAYVFSKEKEHLVVFGITFISIVLFFGFICIINHTPCMVERKTVELNNTYKILSEYKDSGRYAENIIDYNTKVSLMKIRLKSIWSKWFINPAYEDAKLIEGELKNVDS